MELTTKDWKEFRIGDLFDQIGSTAVKKPFDKRNTPEDEFIIPALSSKIDNNSFGFYVREEDHLLINRLCLSVTLNGDAGKVYVQNKAFAIAQDAYAIYLKDDFNILNNEAIYLFLATIMEKVLMPKYGYTNKATWNKVKKETLLLPSKNDEPDWDFMEEFIKEIEEENKEKLAVLKDVKPVDDEIDISDWHEFRLTEIFKNVSKGTRIKQSDRVSGEIPLITAGELNNGFSCYIEKNDTLFKGKCITIDMFGNTFYRDYDFYADDNVIVLNREDLNEFHLLFLTSVIAKATKIYSYVEQFRLKSLSKTLIKLPSIYNQETNEYEPDWEYMENFITNQQAKIKDQLKELKR